MASVIPSLPSFDPCVLMEPSLDDLLGEPIVQLFMARDHLDASEMRQQIERIRRESTIANA